jgi:hypothetical protein
MTGVIRLRTKSFLAQFNDLFSSAERRILRSQSLSGGHRKRCDRDRAECAIEDRFLCGRATLCFSTTFVEAGMNQGLPPCTASQS